MALRDQKYNKSRNSILDFQRKILQIRPRFLQNTIEGAAFWDPSDLRCWAGDMLKLPAHTPLERSQQKFSKFDIASIEKAQQAKEDRITNW
ncbi:hypothetical protein MJO28_007682 [Puccinia striiformis f. sp. tritici]|uniref:Uncharacterized protein n=1 Tax=Puccinia striiformis f. sp. tritici TaxID=168172 RepID=A0ACC0EGT0_9BASI|nr:hypothetical protein MJO28_007682 [Puccinia striiformis f. sp. tritici]